MNVFLVKYSYYYSYYDGYFSKKNCSYDNGFNIQLHDAASELILMEDKNDMLIRSSLHFICFDIRDLAIGILKMLIPFCLSDVLQIAV